jgi:methylthioribose-1-phosphate isomerase
MTAASMPNSAGATAPGDGGAPVPLTRPPTIRWVGEVPGHLEILDQRRLPTETVVLALHTVEDVWQAIKTLAVRGAPAIGVAAAYGMVMAARTVPPTSQSANLIDVLQSMGAYLKTARVTAVNLEWAVDQMVRLAITERAIGVRQLQVRLLQEAHSIRDEDARMCLAIGRNGRRFVKDGGGVLTHCNAGALATADHGTALSILYEAQRQGATFRVYADETRPLLQGARLTAWELAASGVDVTLICDNMAGLIMRQNKVDVVVVGADRIARNGDVANKIGTYSVAQLARAHGIPFVVAAPSNTFDLSLASGEQIPIEERGAEEITHGFGRETAPPGVKAYNPAFDVTPAGLITAIVTERGVISPVNEEGIRGMIDCILPGGR